MRAKIRNFGNVCTLFVFLWGLYGFHWYDTAIGTTIDRMSVVFLGINMVICLICVALIITSRTIVLPKFFRGLHILLATFFIYGCLCLIGGDAYYLDGHAVNKGSYLIGILRSYLPLYAFYYFAIKGYLNKNNIMLYFVILFVFSLIYDLFFTRYWYSLGYENGFTNNLGYVFISFFPFVFLFKQKPIIQYILLALIVGFTITSMKRGAILISALLLIWFFYDSVSHGSLSKRVFGVFLSIVLVLAGYYYTIQLFDASSFFQARLEETLEGDSSGRDILYMTLWDYYWNDTNLFQKIFGSGANATFGVIGKEAHNDWLDILLCQGLFGVFVYAFFWFNSLLYWRRISKNSIYYYIIGSFLLTQFMRTLFSMSYSTVPTAASLILGYSIAMAEMHVQT